MDSRAREIIRTHSDLVRIPDYMGRFNYLKIGGVVGEDTFGHDRYLNQEFYHSKEWEQIRNYVITRDMGNDMSMDGYEIHGRIYVHHMNPVSTSDILSRSRFLLDPEYIVSVAWNTHKAIHYGDEELLPHEPVERRPNDTCPWKH